MIVNVLFFCTGATLAREMGAIFGDWAELATGLVQLALVIFMGEVLPKAIGVTHPEWIALRTAKILTVWSKIATPITKMTLKIEKLLNPAFEEKQLSHDELKMLFSLSTDSQLGNEKGLIEEIVYMTETRISEIMTPRVDVLFAERDTDPQLLIEKAAKHEISSIPIYHKDEDQIIGVVQTRKLYLTGKSVRSCIEPAVFVPETKRVNMMLTEFVEKNLRIAIVVDEYGGVAGVITLEDLLPKVSEDFADEWESEIEEISENTFRLNGRMPIREWKTLFVGFSDEHDFKGLAFDTVGGLIISLLGHMPKSGETVVFKNLKFTVEKVSDKNIQTVLLQRINKGKN